MHLEYIESLDQLTTSVYKEHYPYAGGLVRANMIASLDGRASLNGRSGDLSNGYDRKIFSWLRATSDLIVVGKQTALVEGYRAAKITSEEAIVLRAELELPDQLPIYAVTKSPQESDLPEGIEPVNLSQAFELARSSRAQGKACLFEGGPSLLAKFLANGYVDELCLTLVYKLIGTDPVPLVNDTLPGAIDFEPASLLVTSNSLHLRLVRTLAPSKKMSCPGTI
jgi:riboflavin biosynthesis pyrimidine reductase